MGQVTNTSDCCADTPSALRFCLLWRRFCISLRAPQPSTGFDLFRFLRVHFLTTSSLRFFVTLLPRFQPGELSLCQPCCRARTCCT